jgi:tRNA modification GTPase
MTTRFAVLTPPGTGAIATVALGGPRAWAVARALFRPAAGALPDEPPAGRFWFGTLGTGAGDEVVLAARSADPPAVEVHCHGGREVVRMIGELFQQQGCVACPWTELPHPAGPVRTTNALAAEALVQARTERTAGVLLDQLGGVFDRAVADAVAALDRGEVTAAGRAVGELARFADLGRHLVEPWRVAVAGAPNVGKSSLVNALAGFPRSVVAAVPGTTRDTVTMTLALDGWPVELADTAGVREAEEELERRGIARTRRALADADLCLWLLDATAPPVWPEPADRDRGRWLFVRNKIDQPPGWDPAGAGELVHVSARTREGLGELMGAIVRRLVPESPPPGAAVPFTPALADAAGEARRRLDAGDIAGARLALTAIVSPG